jgi:hypothetical protein
MVEIRIFDFGRLPSVYTKQKDLGDEHQYIIDRKRAKKYVGNMLTRPSLLLNERVKQDTQFSEDPTLRSGQKIEDGITAGAAAYASAASVYPSPPSFNSSLSCLTLHLQCDISIAIDVITNGITNHST